MKSYFTEESIQLMLKLAGISNIIWGLLILFAPQLLFKLVGIDAPQYSEFVQWLGVVIVFFGIGYLIASLEPQRHWLIVFVGFLSKFFSCLIFLKAYLAGTFPISFSSMIIIGNVLWLIPFYYTLLFAYEINTLEDSAPKKFNDLIKVIKTTKGQTLYDLSEKENVLLIFVRHFGCTFCRETVSEMAKLKQNIEGKNLTPVFVHMSDPDFGDKFFAQYYTAPIAHISDPQRLLYKSLNLKRGSLGQLFGPKNIIRGLWAGVIKGHGIGAFEGDFLQLGGYFILSKGQIIFEHKLKMASELIELQIIPKT